MTITCFGSAFIGLKMGFHILSSWSPASSSCPSSNEHWQFFFL